MHARNQAVLELSHLAGIKHGSLTKGSETLKIIYQPAFNPWGSDSPQLSLSIEDSAQTVLSIDEIAAKFQDQLIKVRKEEIRRGVTTIGPHRDDLLFSANGIDLGVYGSRGQIRTAVMSLKFAEMDWLRGKIR